MPRVRGRPGRPAPPEVTPAVPPVRANHVRAL
ncbi:Hypothetical protein SLIV_27027 [Streptomyces lividans TK24]|uniref:Uncharacterized protein n=1 Tax=Streptomyces lividans TK24 TaxID=457428 RepID=A0ABX6TUH0_STRLI|nr:Hypothetical protein SLIV_27027 [Streptomyces lividans TK24]QSJ11900.1 Hypothetical protein SLIVDG2_27027 [Streptomyces lividans]QTD72810.1 Hypothetical protein SLIVYQS_27027 [Streptomyces lividans TK24] [Streptomyces lividans]